MTETETETETPPEAPIEPTPEEQEEGEQGTPVEDEPEQEPVTEQEPPEPAGLTERDMEKRVASLEREGTRHANRVSEILAEDAQLLKPCPLCAGPFVGFIWPDAGANMDDAQREQVKAAIGEASAGYAPASHTAKCADCNGKGDVLSGSSKPGMTLVQCPRCGGKGYKVTSSGETAQIAEGNGNVEHPAPVAASEPPPDRDPWGRPAFHPKFGTMPQYDPTYNRADFFPVESAAV